MTPPLTALMLVAGTAPTTRQDIGQTIKDAVDQATREATQEASAAKQEALREAQQQVRDAQQQLRDAQQQVRDAQQQLRDARTADQRGAATQAIVGAQQGVRAAEIELRRIEAQTKSAPFVWTSQPPDFPFQRPTIPPQAVDIAIGFFVTCAVIVVGWPISRALGRRYERRGVAPLLDAGMTDQLQRIEQAVEAIAIEVERISEGQRFLAKLHEKSASTVE